MVVYSYSKIASELKGDIISEKLIVDKKEILVKDKDELAISEEFQAAAEGLDELVAYQACEQFRCPGIQPAEESAFAYGRQDAAAVDFLDDKRHCKHRRRRRLTLK